MADLVYPFGHLTPNQVLSHVLSIWPLDTKPLLLNLTHIWGISGHQGIELFGLIDTRWIMDFQFVRPKSVRPLYSPLVRPRSFRSNEG